MKKKLSQELRGREAYISRHAISFVIKGKQHIRTYEGEILTANAGEFFIFKRGIYSISDLLGKDEGFESYLVFFTDDLISKLGFDSQQGYALGESKDLNLFKQPPYLTAFWQSIESLYHNYKEKASKLFPIKLQELFSILEVEIAEFSPSLIALQELKSLSLKAFMEQNFDKPLTIEDYAYLSGRSESTFRREFKSKFDITPRKWIISKRMEKARQLLGSTHWEVGRIAMEVGYENTSHFISEFKKHFGYTPSKAEVSRLGISDRKTAS
ncbi:MAG: AraC family transcriptional regulator [Bacteroidia bacterium]|nr:AraC family transcriptional regulator [Bacteroidia bacterium]